MSIPSLRSWKTFVALVVAATGLAIGISAALGASKADARRLRRG